MAKAKKSVVKSQSQKEIDSYEHKGSDRVSIPQVGLVKPETDPDTGKKKKYAYDPHLDPQLQWAGKAEHTSFEVPTASLHIHERIDPRRIVESVRAKEDTPQLSLFDSGKKPLREAVEFYKHKENWSNRLIAGDSLLVMNSLLEKEGMAGKVQMVYFDPPYGIKYGSNFMPFVNKKSVTDGKDEDLSSEPEMLKAFRDTWELGIHSYLTYLRDRILLAKELLNDSGSIFVQISDENLHHIREIMDEVFGVENFITIITFRKSNIPGNTNYLGKVVDYIIVYSKCKPKLKYNQLFTKKDLSVDIGNYNLLELENGEIIRINNETYKDILDGKLKGKLFTTVDMFSQGDSNTLNFDIEFNGKIYKVKSDKHWKTTLNGVNTLIKSNRIISFGDRIYYKLYYDDYPVSQLLNVWYDTRAVMSKIYAVQTDIAPIIRCILMSTNPGDIVLDITCGSGTTAYVSEQLGRRWITCDTSRIALTLAKQRLMTATFDFYEFAYPNCKYPINQTVDN